MIAHPLELESRLSPPPRDLDFVAWVNLGAIALFFVLFGSRFVLTPGLRVGVGESDALELPKGGMQTEATGPASVVVSYRRDNVILFEGGMYSLAELGKHLVSYVQRHPRAEMLVRCDRQVSAQDLFALCDLAHAAGFAQVLLASEPQPTANLGK